MNKIHAAVIAHLRRVSKETDGKLHAHLEPLTDAQVAKLMFSSVRGTGDGARGLRLTESGLDMMRDHFRHFAITYPDGHRLQASDLVYLDRAATLPYYLSARKLVVFETTLGMALKIVDGDITQACGFDDR